MLPLELGPDGYRDTTPVVDDEAFAATAPFAITVRPVELGRRLSRGGRPPGRGPAGGVGGGR